MMNRFGFQEHSYQSKLGSLLPHNDHPHGHALLLVFGTNVFGEGSENLLAISAACFGLLAWPWMMGTVYKNWYLGVLEASFILILGISAAATSYVQQAVRKSGRCFLYVNQHSICDLHCNLALSHRLAD